MHFHFSFYSSLLLIFFTHGVLFSVLLLRKAVLQNDKASLWLAGFTLVCTLNIAPWMLGHAGWYSLQPYRNVLFYLPLQNFFLLGPLILFYTKALLNPGSGLGRKERFHFLPAALYVLYTFVLFAVDELVLKRPFFYADGHDRDLDAWYRMAGIVSLSYYLYLSLRYYAVYKKAAVQIVSFADELLFSWIKRYSMALLAMQFLDVLFFCLYPSWGNFTAKWWYYFVFSGLFYYVAFAGLTNTTKPLFSFKLLGKSSGILKLEQQQQVISFLPVQKLETDTEQEIDTGWTESNPATQYNEEWNRWKDVLLQLLTTKEAYKDPELTLSSLARHMQTNASVLSKVINKGFGSNFNDFINKYRVSAVKQYIADGQHKRQTLLGIALDCGFNSKTTFNRVFKKHTGLSPKEYILQIKAPPRPEPGNACEQYGVPNHDLERPHSTEMPSSP